MIRAHHDAFMARLREHPMLATCTYDTNPTGATRPERYCVVYSTNGARSAERLTGPDVTADVHHTVHCVGMTTAQAQLVAEKVFEQVLNWTPNIAGRRSRRVRHLGSRPIAVDEEITPNLWFTVDVFGVTRAPAA